MELKEWYRRNLPHLQPLDGTFNICFRLFASLPVSGIRELQEERKILFEILERQEPFLLPSLFWKEKAKIHNQYFGKFDDLLDHPHSGPTYLKNEKIAKIVKDALHFWDGKKLRLICYCIMPNHVHLVIDSCKDQLFKLLKSIKNYSGRLANQQLDRTGKKFWQKESYDNLIRDNKAMKIKINYILNNPVKARLVKNWADWPHNYLNPEFIGYLDQGVRLK